MMNTGQWKWITIVFMLVGVGELFAQIQQTVAEKGLVDWGSGIIRVSARGTAAPSVTPGDVNSVAQELARKAVIEQLRDMTHTIALDGDRLLVERLQNNADLNADLQQKLTGFRILDVDYLTRKRGVLLTAELELAALYSLLSARTDANMLPDSISAATATEAAAGDTGIIYQRIVVRAGGLDARPALYPRLLDNMGNTLFIAVSHQNGRNPVRYTGSAADTSVDLLLNAIDTAGKYHANLILDEASATRLADALQKEQLHEYLQLVIALEDIAGDSRETSVKPVH